MARRERIVRETKERSVVWFWQESGIQLLEQLRRTQIERKVERIQCDERVDHQRQVGAQKDRSLQVEMPVSEYFAVNLSL